MQRSWVHPNFSLLFILHRINSYIPFASIVHEFYMLVFMRQSLGIKLRIHNGDCVSLLLKTLTFKQLHVTSDTVNVQLKHILILSMVEDSL